MTPARRIALGSYFLLLGVLYVLWVPRIVHVEDEGAPWQEAGYAPLWRITSPPARFVRYAAAVAAHEENKSTFGDIAPPVPPTSDVAAFAGWLRAANPGAYENLDDKALVQYALRQVPQLKVFDGQQAVAGYFLVHTKDRGSEYLNVWGAVNDPEFQQLSPDGRRKVLAGVTGDNAFMSLSDDDLNTFVSALAPNQPPSSASAPRANAVPKEEATPPDFSSSLPAPPEPSGYIEPSLFRLAAIDWTRLKLETTGLTALLGAAWTFLGWRPAKQG